jgi:broad specificity phosphatase PhoE
MPIRRVILVRHGETEHNRSRLSLGRADVPLNARGLAQAAAVGASFARAPAAIYSSPLQRAVNTAEAIAMATGLDVQIDDAFIEMDVGELEHLTGDELRRDHPEFLRRWLSEEAGDVQMPGGESLSETQARAWAGLERITALASGQGEVVVVTHNFVILTVVCRALGMPLGQFRRLRHQVGARTVLDMGGAAPALISMNDTAHLLAAGLAGEPPRQETKR